MMFMPSIFDDRLFDDFMENVAQPAADAAKFLAPANMAMRTDIRSTEDSYELDIDLPGYTKENINAELKDGYLKITAKNEKSDEEKDAEGKYIRRERFYGSCSRSYYIGNDVNQNDIRARFEDGILKISIPKKNSEECDTAITIE